MKVWTEMSAGARTAVVAGGAVVVAILGYFGFERAPEPPPAPVAVSAPVDPKPAATPEAIPAAEPAPVAAAEPIDPALDVVRVAPDGSATVAGRAEPGAVVSLRVDGAEVLQVTADAAGNFVALFDLVASELPRLLSVVAIGVDGIEVVGRDTVALAPIKPRLADGTFPAVLPAPAAILVSPEGVKVLQPTVEIPAEVAANVSVDTIAYTANGAVQLGGHGQAGGVLRVYLDTAVAGETSVAADGTWSLILGDVAPGIYTLRVDQLAADGTVTSRFETPFKRETLESLAAATAAIAAPEAPVEVVAKPAPAAEPIAVAEPAPMPEPTPVNEPAQAIAPVPAEEPTPMDATPPVPPANVAVNSTAPEAAPVAKAGDAPHVASNDTAPVAPAVAQPAPEEPAALAQPTPAGLVSVTVQPGFTLWGIAKAEFGEGVLYVQVFDANREKIKNPDLIYPGQIFLIPGKN